MPRFRHRIRNGAIYYFYDHGGKPRQETALGRDYATAIKMWAELEHARTIPVAALVTLRQVAERFNAEFIPTKSLGTQRLYRRCIEALLSYFDKPPIPFERIRPIHIRKYLDWRPSKVIANREVALLSNLWNWARERGITDLSNPCEGVRRNKEHGRDVYVDDDAFAAVYKHGDQTLRDAMDLAYLTGQRVGDVWSLDAKQITDAGLTLRQGKTGHKLVIDVTGELSSLLDRIAARKKDLPGKSSRLIVDAEGMEIGRAALRYRFDKARLAAGINIEGFQLRDLRAKAGTDKADSAKDIREAQAQLGHASVTTTEIYVRKKRGAKASPTR